MINSINLDQPFLSFKQIKDVFHELGHAMHIALSNTKFQLINGVRVPIDFAEIPSNFTENFVYDYDFMKQFIVDQEGNPINQESFEKLVVKERAAEMMELQELFYFSLMDLYLHKLQKNELSQKKMIEMHSKAVIYNLIKGFIASFRINI